VGELGRVEEHFGDGRRRELYWLGHGLPLISLITINAVFIGKDKPSSRTYI
jgi:hypothetical protein